MRARSAAKRAGGEPPPTDTFTQRLVKLIPSEVIGTFLVIDGLLQAGANQVPLVPVFFLLFSLFLVGTPLYLWRFEQIRSPLQLTLSMFSFVVWVFATGGVIRQVVPAFTPVMGGLLLAAYTFAATVLLGPKKASPEGVPSPGG
ncbi:hypothetical protein [Sorangium sp. So ce204]|uniref:hypothetical protein n=1 Tax=Sorangium sp. So ce204 TaxID=3133288 RepID=UPI003F64653E